MTEVVEKDYFADKMQLLSENFAEIVKTYNLKEKKIRNNVMAYISSNYVLMVTIEHFGITLSYSTKEDLPNMYYCNNFLAEAFDDNDRVGIQLGDDANTRIKNDILVTSRGLVSKWENILKGDTKWLEDYKKSRWYSMHPQPRIDKTIFD